MNTTNTIAKNLLPFDLETALANPSRVVTRDGRKVTQLHRFDVESYQLHGVIGGCVARWADSGQTAEYVPNCSTDLFLLPETRETFYNVYNDLRSVLQYPSLEEAKTVASKSVAAMIKIKWEGETPVSCEIVHHYNP